jgi:hypothetical protein
MSADRIVTLMEDGTGIENRFDIQFFKNSNTDKESQLRFLFT